jgi:hypothetical protein
MRMKKFFALFAGAFVLFGAGFLVGMNSFVKGNIASIVFKNQAERSIMTAVVSHETGSTIAANIKRDRSQRVRFFTKGPNRYSLKITFDDNRTIYSASDRAIKNGEVNIETVRDSVIVGTADK